MYGHESHHNGKNLLTFLSLYILGAIFVPFSTSVVAINKSENTSVLENKSRTTTDTKDLATLQKTDPTEIAKLSKYDSRDYGIVTPVKDQANPGIGWAYVGSSTAETNILRLGLATDKSKVDFSPQYLDYATNKRNNSWNLMSINRNDVIDRPLQGQHASTVGEETYAVWGAPTYQSDYEKYGNAYTPSPFILEESEFFMDEKDPDVFTSKFTEENQRRRVANVKLGIAKYGALTFDTSVDPRADGHGPEYYYNQRGITKISKHALTVVGWDDTIEASRFSPATPPGPGAWIVKDSWGTSAHGKMEGYFYMSYHSSYGTCIGYKFTQPNKYNNNYHWDVGEPYNDNQDGLNYFATNENAAIFPVQKANFDVDEYLNAVNVTVVGKDVTLDVEVYNNVTGVDILQPYNENINPRSGELVEKMTRKYKYGGTKTIPLKTPAKLEKGQYFSVIAKVSNPTNDALISLSTDPSKDDMTYSHVGDKWINEHKNMENGAATARIRAFTTETKNPSLTSTALGNASVILDKSKYRFGDKNKPIPVEVKIGDTKLTSDDYTYSYGEPKFYSDGSKVWSDNDDIGYGFVTITGKNRYKGTITVFYDIVVGITPDLGENGWYTKDSDDIKRVANIRIKNGWSTYNQIILPAGFEWINGSSSSNIDKNNPLALDYKGDGYQYYRYTTFYPPRTLVLLNADAVKPTSPPVVPVAPAPAPAPQHAPTLPDPDPTPPTPLPPTPPPTPKPEVSSVSLSTNSSSNTFNENQTVIFTANIQPATATSGVQYEWMLGEDKIATTYSNSYARNCLASDDKKQFKVKVVQEVNGHHIERISNVITLNVITKPVPPPPPPPKPEPLPPPAPAPVLESVAILNLSPWYYVGQEVRLQASVQGVEISKVNIKWNLEDTTIESSEQTFIFKANKVYDNKNITLTAEYNGVTKTATKTLKIQPKKNIPVIKDNYFTKNKLFFIILIICVFAYILLIILISSIIHKRRKNREERL